MPHTVPTQPPDTVATHMGHTQSDCELAVVDWLGGVDLTGAPVDPGADPVRTHCQGPVAVGLEAMMPATQARQVSQDRRPDGEGDDMVEVAETGRGGATREATEHVPFANGLR